MDTLYNSTDLEDWYFMGVGFSTGDYGQGWVSFKKRLRVETMTLTYALERKVRNTSAGENARNNRAIISGLLGRLAIALGMMWG